MTPDELARFLAGPEPSLGDGLLHLSSILSPRADALEVGQQLLDDLAAGVDDVTIPALVHHLFARAGFFGDIDTYHDENNSFLDRVLERRTGMPITLSAVVTEVGKRIGLDLELIGMPGHVIVGVPGNRDSFIDAYGGTELNADGVQRRFESIFGEGTEIPPGSLRPMDTTATINRVCNNLTRTWALDDASRLNRLLEVRAALPATDIERRLLVEIAETRGRFDIAARIREELNPDDPLIPSLWARLN